MEKDRNYRPRYPEMQEKYEVTSPKERNSDLQEYRWYSVCTSMQPSDKDTERMAVCKNSGIGQPDTDTGRKGCAGERHHVGYKNFSGKGFQTEAETCSGRRNRKRYPENENRNDFRHGTDGGRNRPDKKGHWAVENSLRHVPDDTSREDRSPAKRSKHNLALIRKFAHNILRTAILSGDCAEIMTEAMDEFCGDPSLRKKYVYKK